MKKGIILAALIFVSFLFTSCQKAKEPEKKEAQVQKQPSEVKPEVHPQPAVPAAKEEKPVPMEPSPLTEEEQKYIEKIGNGPLITPNAFKSKDDAITYLKMLLKGNHRNVRFFHEYYKERAQTEYDIAIGSALSILNPKDKEVSELFVRVLEEKRDYPRAVARAIKKLKGSGDKRVIELDKELIKQPDPGIRLEAAGALLIEGYPDLALPALNELVEKEGYSSALYYLFTGTGKIIDERGYKIVEKALNNPKAEVRITAVKLLLESKKIKKEKAEEIALTTLNIFKSSKEYGITFDPNRGIIPTPGSEKDFERSNQQWGSDWRAIEKAIYILVELKSKKAISALERLAINPDASYLQNRAKEALSDLRKEK